MDTQSQPAAPIDLPPLLPQTERVMAQLFAAPAVQAALAAAERDTAVTLADQIALSEIESPPFHEDVRAADFARRLRELGLADVRIDAEGNVIGVRRGAGDGPRLVLAAHLDTVFAAGTDVKVRRDGERYLGPGISDDARGLAVLLQVLRTLDEQDVKTVGDVLFVGTVGEEGNGDLRGCKALFATDNAIDGFIAVDGVAVTRILANATGSRRYRVGYEGPGGHSYNAFGNPSATHALGRAIAAISEVRVPDEPRTTFTVGTVKGGTTVNSIAASAEMELDMRSDSGDELERLVAGILPLLEVAAAAENRRWNAPADRQVKLVLTPIGDRPAGRAGTRDCGAAGCPRSPGCARHSTAEVLGGEHRPQRAGEPRHPRHDAGWRRRRGQQPHAARMVRADPGLAGPAAHVADRACLGRCGGRERAAACRPGIRPGAALTGG